MATTRTAKSARNVWMSILTQIVVILLGFVNRTVFIAQLGIAMQGVSALITSVASILMLADLGINGALMFALYRPLRAGDDKKVAAIVRYSGRLFTWVSLAVVVLGLAVTPFLRLLENLEQSVPLLEVYFLVLLANTACSYLFLNRAVLLNADQKIYLTKIFLLIFHILRSTLQIISLLVFADFLLYLAIQVVFTLANNVAVYWKAGRVYPFLRRDAHSEFPRITTDERASILQSTRAMMVYRIGELLLLNSTPVFISIMVGTVVLGQYSNYMLIMGAAVMLIEVVFAAIVPTVGNLVVDGDRAVARSVFDEMVMLAAVVHGVVAIGFVTMANDFVSLWLGDALTLPIAVVAVFVADFYVAGSLLPVFAFRNATGLFRQTRFIIVATVIVNTILSIVLGMAFGLIGIVFAPLLAQIVTLAWYEPRLLVRGHLEGSLRSYFGMQTTAFVVTVALAVIVWLVGDSLGLSALPRMIVKTALLLVLSALVCILLHKRSRSFRLLWGRTRTLIQRRNSVH